MRHQENQRPKKRDKFNMEIENHSIGSLVDSDAEVVDWFVTLSKLEQDKIMSDIKANFIANSSFKLKQSRLFFQEIDGKLNVVGVEGDLAKPKE